MFHIPYGKLFFKSDQMTNVILILLTQGFKSRDFANRNQMIPGSALLCNILIVFILILGEGEVHDFILSCLFSVLPSILHCSDENYLCKGNQLAEDKPDVDHSDV